DGDSSGDDADDEDGEEEEEEEEEHLALTDSAVIVPTVELVSPPEGTELVTPPPSTEITTTPASGFHIPSTRGRGERLTRIASTQALVDAVTAALPSPPLPLLPQSLYIPPPVDHRDDILESERPPRKSTLDAKERRRGIREVRYGIRDTWVDPAEAVPDIAPMTVEEDSRTHISQRVTMDSQRVDLLMEDRIAYQGTILIIEEEAYASREAWVHSIGLSQAVHYTEMAELRETDHICKAQMVEILRVMRDMRREMGDMQVELLALRKQQRRARQLGPDVRVLDNQDASTEADSYL
ncbi:hypothetical protein Tco_1492280, partial [Tanacetum coccineum]